MALLAPEQAIEYYQQTGKLPSGYTQEEINELLGETDTPSFYVSPKGERIATLSNGDSINLDTGQVYQLMIDPVVDGNAPTKISLSEEEISSELKNLRERLGIDEPSTGLEKPKEDGGTSSGYYCSPDNTSEYCEGLRAQKRAEDDAKAAKEAAEAQEEYEKQARREQEEADYDPYDPNRPEYDRTLVRERELQELQNQSEQGIPGVDSPYSDYLGSNYGNYYGNYGNYDNYYDGAYNQWASGIINQFGSVQAYYDYMDERAAASYQEYINNREDPDLTDMYDAQTEYQNFLDSISGYIGDNVNVLPDLTDMDPNVDGIITRDEDDVYVLPDFPVTATEMTDEENAEYDRLRELEGIDLTQEQPVNILEIPDGLPDVDTPKVVFDDINKARDVLERYDDTRLAYNKLLREEKYLDFQNELTASLLDAATPAQGAEFPLTKLDAITDQITNLSLGGDLDPLNSLAVAVNTIEGMIGKELVNIPNAGYLINNLVDKMVPQGIQDYVEEKTPGFFDRFRQTALQGPSSYLNQGFNLTDSLLRNDFFAKNIRYGLPPATEQKIAQYEDFFTELGVQPPSSGIYLGEIGYRPDEDDGTVYKESDAFDGVMFDDEGNITRKYQNYLDDVLDPISGPGFIERTFTGAGDTVTSVAEGIGGFIQDVGFNYQKLMGGNAQKLLASYILPAVQIAGFPVPLTLILDTLSKMVSPTSAQELSDYLYSKGIDPTTATMDDVALLTFGGGLDEPPGDEAITGITTGIPGGNVIYATDDEIKAYEDQKRYEQALDDARGSPTYIDTTTETTEPAGRFNFDITETDSTPITTTTTTEGILPSETPGIDIFSTTGQTGANTREGFFVGGGGDGGIFDKLPDRFNLDTTTTGTTTTGTTTTGDTTTTGIDSTGIINNGNNMAENNTLAMGDAYDPAYELARILYGADVASQFAGGGLAQTDFQDLVDRYQRDVEGRAFGRTSTLAGREQELVNRLREQQRVADVGLLGEFGQPMADALRSVDPRIEQQVTSQQNLAQRLYREAEGDFSPEREAEILERAFETSQMQGRERDPRLAYDRLLGAEDARTAREQRAQQAGVNLFNQAQAQTGAAPGLVLGLQGSPYERGVGTISPVFGATAAVNQSLQNYQNQQNLAVNREAQNTLTSLYNRAQKTGDLSTLEKVNKTLDDFNAGLTTITGVTEFIGGLPDAYNDLTEGFSKLVGAAKTVVGAAKNVPLLGDAVGLAGDAVSKVVDFAGDVGSGAVDFAGDIGSGVVDFAGDVGSAAVDGLMTLIGGGANVASGAVDYTQDLFDYGSDLASGAVDYTQDLFDYGSDAATDITGFMGEILGSGASSATDTFMDVTDDLFDVGKSVVDYGKNIFKALWG